MARLLTQGYENGIAAPTGTVALVYDQNLDPTYWPFFQKFPSQATPTVGLVSGRAGGSGITVEDGAYLALTSLASNWVLGRRYYMRVFINVDRFGNTFDTCWAMRIRVGSSNLGIRIISNGARTAPIFYGALGDSGTGADQQVLGPQVTRSLDTWYMLEMSWVIGTGAVDQFHWRIDEEPIYSATVLSLSDSLPSSGVGVITAALGDWDGQTTNAWFYAVWYDDLALNDDQGASQNSWPGEGRVIHVKPASDNARVNWTGGAGGTTNLFDAVNNTPPIGQSGAGTNLSQIRNPTSGATANYDANMQTYTAAGLPAGATVQLVQGYIRHGAEATQSPVAGAVQIVSNPSSGAETAIASVIGFSTSGVAVAAGNESASPAGWRQSSTPVLYAPSVTVGTAPVFRVGKRTASGRVFAVDQMWLLVEYTPRKYTVGIPETASASDSVSVTRRKVIDITAIDLRERMLRDGAAILYDFASTGLEFRDSVIPSDTDVLLKPYSEFNVGSASPPWVDPDYQQPGLVAASASPSGSVLVGERKLLYSFTMNRVRDIIGDRGVRYAVPVIKRRWAAEFVITPTGPSLVSRRYFKVGNSVGLFRLLSDSSSRLLIKVDDYSGGYITSTITGPVMTDGTRYHVMVANELGQASVSRSEQWHLWVNGVHYPTTGTAFFGGVYGEVADGAWDAEVGKGQAFGSPDGTVSDSCYFELIAFYTKGYAFAGTPDSGLANTFGDALPTEHYNRSKDPYSGVGEFARASDSPRLTKFIRTGIAPPTHSAEILADSPYIYYKMNEAGNTDAPIDSSGNGLNATVTGTDHVAQQDSPVRSEVSFSRGITANANRFSLPSTVDFAGSYTLEAWIRVVSSAIIILYPSAQGADTYDVSLIVDTTSITFRRGGARVIHSGLSADTWYHVVAVWTGEMMLLYRDGQLVGSRRAKQTMQSGGVAHHIFGSPAIAFSGTQNGRISHWAMYPTALGIERIRAHYAGRWTIPERSAVVTGSESVVLVKTTPIQRSISESAPATDTLTRIASYVRALANAVTGSDVATYKLNRTYAVPVSETAGAVDALTRTALFSRAIAETVAGAETLTTVVLRSISVGNTASASDVLTRVASYARSLAESAPASEAVVVIYIPISPVADVEPVIFIGRGPATSLGGAGVQRS